MKIVIVEDEPTDRKLMRVVFQGSGHEVVEKISAERALQTIAEEQPDVVMLDLHLPGTDGLTLARQLKADPVTQRIPIVAVTAAADGFSKDAALQAGCDAYLVKPLDTRNLAAQVGAVVRAKS